MSFLFGFIFSEWPKVIKDKSVSKKGFINFITVLRRHINLGRTFF
jgi:hypothetical protein